MMAGATLVMFVNALAPGFAVLIILRIAFGLTILFRELARAILTQQWFPRHEIVLVSSMSNLLFGIVVSGGLVATPVILDAVDNDWRGVFRVFGVAFGALTLLWIALGRDGPRRDRDRQSSGIKDLALIKTALNHRDLWIAGMGFFGFMLSYSAFFSFFPTLMEDAHDISVQRSGIVMAISIFAGGFAGVGFGYIALDFDRGKSIMRVLGLIVVGTYVGMTLTGSMPVLVTLSFLNGIGAGFFPILITVPFLLPGIRPREVAVASSVIMMMMAAGGVLGPMLAGFIGEGTGSLKTGLIVCSLSSVSLTVAAFTLKLRSVPAPTD